MWSTFVNWQSIVSNFLLDKSLHRDMIVVNLSIPLGSFVGLLVTADLFDCFVLSQWLQFVYNIPVRNTHTCRLLCPGDLVRVAVPCVSQIAPRYGAATGFTQVSCDVLISEVFGMGRAAVQTYASIFMTIAFLTRTTHKELSWNKLGMQDPYYPLILGLAGVPTWQ